MPPNNEVSGDEAAAVFRRAAELDQTRTGAPARGLDLEALEQAGLEAGLSRDAIRQALAEVKAGSLEPGERLPEAVVARTVAGRERELDRDVERFMHQQTYRVARRLDDRTIWVPDSGFAAQMRRGFDFNKRVVVREATRITTCVVPVPGEAERCHVRFEADFGRTRWGWYSIPMATAGISLGSAITMALGLDPGTILISAPVGAALTGGAFVGARAGYRSSIRRTVDGIERFLDHLQYGR